MGLQQGVDYVAGDPFPNNSNLRTAKFIGDPIKTSIKAIDKGGFYTATGKPRWSYLNNISGINTWSQMTYDQKAQVIAQMYHYEGGDGSLVASINKKPSSNLFSFNGGGGPVTTNNSSSSNPSPIQGFPSLNRLGNVTTQYGQADRDTNFHTGIDIANRQDTPIPKLSGLGGQVQSVRPNGDYGNQVVVKNDDGTTETYSHLHQAFVKPGQRVQPGQQLASMGHSGNSWSPSGGDPSHLHFEVTDAFNNFVNPNKFLS
jgi:murein DD-endopeptidase MepM/ murein hydrolase activator NlpD